MSASPDRPALADPGPALARALSILGHPAVLMPLGTAGAAIARGAHPESLGTALAVVGAIVLVVMLYSWWQVRRGRWAHVDASHPAERSGLNAVLAGVLAAVGIVAALAGAGRVWSVSLLVAAALVLVAIAARTQLKVSLHVTFAVFAALLWWPLATAVGAGLVFAAAVAWSRLALRRHVVADVIAGALLGTVGGVVCAAL